MELSKYWSKLFTPRGNDIADPEKTHLKQIADDVGNDWICGPYYELAEDERWINTFWGPESPFRKMFDLLDSAIVLELACGHGRHSEQMKSRDNKKILMDINQANIDFCVNRFAGDPRYRLLLNNGIDCRPLGNASCTAVFCYDAMVHFDSEVLFSYLRDIFRILKPGGRALLHHSNYTGNPGGDYRNNPHWRNFMSQSLFQHYSRKAGFQILESVTMKWGDDYPDLDCLTLVSRPQ